jgi:hypothetical protein
VFRKSAPTNGHLITHSSPILFSIYWVHSLGPASPRKTRQLLLSDTASMRLFLVRTRRSVAQIHSLRLNLRAKSGNIVHTCCNLLQRPQWEVVSFHHGRIGNERASRRWGGGGKCVGSLPHHRMGDLENAKISVESNGRPRVDECGVRSPATASPARTAILFTSETPPVI